MRRAALILVALTFLVSCSSGEDSSEAEPTSTTTTSEYRGLEVEDPTVDELNEELDDLVDELDPPGFQSHADCVVGRGDVGLDVSICDELFPQ